MNASPGPVRRLIGDRAVRNPKNFCLSAMLAVLAGACGCTVVMLTYVDPSPRSETRPAAVQVLWQEPDLPYRVVGQFKFEDKGWGFTREQLDSRMQHEAGCLGGEAVVVVEQHVESHFVFEGLLVGHTAEVSQRVLFSKVIVFTEARKP